MIKEIIMKLLVILVFLLPTANSHSLSFYTNENRPGIMLVEGEFGNQDDVRFEKHIERNKIHTVIWNSIGGKMTPSLNIGIYMRENNLISYIEEKGVCFSACAYAFMGGVVREIIEGGEIAMHRPYFIDEIDGTFNEGYNDGVNTAILIITYLKEMGLDHRYAVDHLFYEKLIPLDRSLIAQYRVTTED